MQSVTPIDDVIDTFFRCGQNRVHITYQVNSALHPSGVAKSSTSFGWGKGGKVTSAGWQVTLCDISYGMWFPVAVW